VRGLRCGVLDTRRRGLPALGQPLALLALLAFVRHLARRSMHEVLPRCAPGPPMTDEPQLLTWCHAGEVIQVENIVQRMESLMVISACGTPGQPFHCVPCGQALANIGQLEMHVAAGGPHRIVTYCRRHGCYEPADRDVVQHLAQLLVPMEGSS
jgi:hypothetical protein